MSRPHSRDSDLAHNSNQNSKDTMKFTLPPRPPVKPWETRNPDRSVPDTTDTQPRPPDPPERRHQENSNPAEQQRPSAPQPRFPSAPRLKTQQMNSKRRIDSALRTDVKRTRDPRRLREEEEKKDLARKETPATSKKEEKQARDPPRMTNKEINQMIQREGKRRREENQRDMDNREADQREEKGLAARMKEGMARLKLIQKETEEKMLRAGWSEERIREPQGRKSDDGSAAKWRREIDERQARQRKEEKERQERERLEEERKERQRREQEQVVVKREVPAGTGTEKRTDRELALMLAQEILQASAMKTETVVDDDETEVEDWTQNKKRMKLTRPEKRQRLNEREAKLKDREDEEGQPLVAGGLDRPEELLKDDGWEKDIEAALEEDISAWAPVKLGKELGKEEPADHGETEAEDGEIDDPEPHPPADHDDNGFKLVYKPRAAANPLIRPPKRPRPATTSSGPRALKPTTVPAAAPPLEPVPQETLDSLSTILDTLLTAFHTDDIPLLNNTLETLSWTLQPPTITHSSLTALSLPTHLRSLLSSPLPPSTSLSITLLLARWSSQVFTPNPSLRFPRRGTYGHPSQQPGHMHFPAGTVFPAQYDAFLAGIHPSPEAGITGMSMFGAYSIVLSHSSYADRDEGEELLYTGTVSTTLDPTRGTELMSTSRRLGTPIRVLRSSKHGGAYSPSFGLRYDGLYRVIDEEVIEAGRNRRFRLRRVKVGSGKLENGVALEACLSRPTRGEVKWLEGVVEERRKRRGEMREAREEGGLVF